MRMPLTPTWGTARPWPFGTSRPSSTPCARSLLTGPHGLRHWAEGPLVREEASFSFSHQARALPLLVLPADLDLQISQRTPVPPPASAESPCWGTREQTWVVGGACGPPSPNFCPCAALLLGTDSAAAGRAWALRRSLCRYSDRVGAGAWGGTGLHCLSSGHRGAGRSCSGAVCVGHLVRVCPGMDLKSLGLCGEGILARVGQGVGVCNLGRA